MNVDSELELWRREWQSEETVPLELRSKVERESRRMKIALIADVLVTVTIGGAMAGWAIRDPQPSIILLAAWTWVVIAAAWAFVVKTNRGNWSPSAEETAVFVELSVRRCRSKLVAMRFAVGLFLVQMAFVLGWVYNNSPVAGTPVLRWLAFSSVPIDIVWLSTAVFFGALAWYRRKERAELEYLFGLRENPDGWNL
ncbi:MAG TPA: hypothetical protein VFW44_01370 [Bryobacteraceae bacterium]|nr:hypothetical protein [Bryobacteraceae bacterium]